MLNLVTALQEDITAGIATAIKKKKIPAPKAVPPIVVKRTDQTEHGDYASPVALALTKVTKVPPLDLVAAIAEHMPKKEYVGKLEAAAPGFLNIRLNPGWLVARLDDVIEQDLCADSTIGAGKRVNLEFISANPTGPLTLGNARTAFSIDTLGNIFSCAGFNVTREYYFNDAGEQVKKLGESVLRRILEAQGEKVDFPPELYQGEYISTVAAPIAEQWHENEGKKFAMKDLEDASLVSEVGRQASQILMAAIKKTIQEDMHIHFDVWTSEQQIRDSGVIDEVLKRLRSQGAIYAKDGAIWLKTTDHGEEKVKRSSGTHSRPQPHQGSGALKPRTEGHAPPASQAWPSGTGDKVLVKRNGEYAYILPDIGYHQDKYNRGFDLIFTVVGPDHQAQMPKVVAAMKELGNDTTKLHILVSQVMRFMSTGKPVKLSKRKGQIVTPQDLIDDVGYDAARFFMVQHALTTHMDFDLDLAREQSERNPVYYIQYAHVRLQSILRRAKEEGIITSLGEAMPLSSHAGLTHTAELALMRQLYRFPEVIHDSATTFAVQSLAYYALDLARAIHFFYKHVPVLNAGDTGLVKSRLQLVLAARKVVVQTLDLLGISKPDVM